MFFSANTEGVLHSIIAEVTASEWLPLGLLLGLSSHELIKINLNRGINKLRMMVYLWVDSGTASWRTLVQALFHLLMNKKELARRISEEHLLESPLTYVLHNQSIH